MTACTVSCGVFVLHVPEDGAGSPRYWWWCSLWLCFQFGFSESSGNLTVGNTSHSWSCPIVINVTQNSRRVKDLHKAPPLDLCCFYSVSIPPLTSYKNFTGTLQLQYQWNKQSRTSPPLWPSQRSCKNRKRSLVNSSFCSTLEPLGERKGYIFIYIHI